VGAKSNKAAGGLMKTAVFFSSRFFIFAFLWLLLAKPAWGSDFILTGGLHGLIAEHGGDFNAGADLEVSFAWAPIPEIAIGLDSSIGVPLKKVSNRSAAVLRLAPMIWMFFGDPQSWGFVKMGIGPSQHFNDAGNPASWVLVGGAGFAVAPRELPFFFGFELHGELKMAGKLPSDAIGLGGFVGWRF
jgi:hypothetical protein